jgi:hypothetical protein
MYRSALAMMFAVLACVVFIDAALGQGSSAKGSRYAAAFVGYPVGSWALHRVEGTRSIRGEMTTSQSEIRYTIEPRKDGRPRVKWQRLRDGKVRAERVTTYYAGRTPIQRRAQAHDLGTETLQIDGKQIRCKKTEYILIEGVRSPRKTTITLWTSDEVNIPDRDLPEYPEFRIASNVLRAKQQTTGKGFTLDMELTVTDLDAKVEVGSRTVTCVTERYTHTYKSDEILDEFKGESAWSHDVPAHLVYQWTEGGKGKRYSKKSVKLVDFKIAK